MADPGDTLHFSAELFDSPPEDGGLPVNASSVALTIGLPDGTTVAATVVNPPADEGVYVYDYVTSPLGPFGRHEGQWVFTLAGGRTESFVQVFDVGAALVTVDEAVAHLGAAGIITRATDLEQLEWLCLAATEAVELDLRQVLVRRTVVASRDGGYPLVSLTPPVLSITSVLEGGVAVTDYAVNKDAGLLYRNSTGWYRWACGVQNVTVTYQAGYLNPPRTVRKVVLNLIQAAWQTSQQAPHPALTEFNEQDTFAAVSALPQVEQRAYESLRMTA